VAERRALVAPHETITLMRQCSLLGLARDHGLIVGRQRLRRAMELLGLEAVRPRQSTSKPAPGHRIHPYLLRDLAVTEPGQVWATDLTYIRLQRGFVYLVAPMDWYSRYVLAWRVGTAMESAFCQKSLEDAPTRHTAPRIHNSDQGSQFTADTFV
jgi:putative transposase